MSPGRACRVLHDGPTGRRLLLKAAFVLLVTGFALFPRLWLIPTWVQRLANPASVLQPDHPELIGLARIVRERTGPQPDPQTVLQVVETVVNERVPYAWDWDTWGVMDYLPTVEETFALGREDCDGRAVVSASLLQHMGYEAWLTSDILHVWVATPAGETMSPSVGGQTMVQTEQGTEVTLGLGLLQNLLRGTTFGLAVFPLWRELLIAAAVLLALLQPRAPVWRQGSGIVLCLLGFGLLRSVGEQVARMESMPLSVWCGYAILVGGLILLAWPGRKQAPTATLADAN